MNTYREFKDKMVQEGIKKLTNNLQIEKPNFFKLDINFLIAEILKQENKNIELNFSDYKKIAG